jgi:mono/diheme cytochrome c family protein
MRSGTRVSLLILVVIVLAGAGAALSIIQHGLSARDQPTALEAFLARGLRRLALPAGARDLQNPIPITEQVLQEGRAHFADHCAFCHGNDGKGQTEIGRHLYPKAPDMASATTQSLSDGELFYIIKNGVRLTGMPAWGEDTAEDDRQSWHLVHFIRHLPRITSMEIEEMKELNPKTRQEFQEEDEVRRFLAGEEAKQPKHHH